MTCFSKACCESPSSFQLGFQAPATTGAETIMNFHNCVMILVIMIVFGVLRFLYLTMVSSKFVSKFYMENEELEFWFTLIPMMSLTIICMPSLMILYTLETIHNPQLTLKMSGHQWYWEYEYPMGNSIPVSFESYLLPTSELEAGELRLLNTSNTVILPMNTNISVSVSSGDVIHSWFVPSLGTKVDAIPGHLNNMGLFIQSAGLFFGMCSEICGTLHSGMPISVSAVNPNIFMEWITSFSSTS